MGDTTRCLAQKYFAAWTSRNREDVAALLDEDLRFTLTTGFTVEVNGREAFLSGEAWPEGVDVALIDEAYQGESGFQMYDARHKDATLRVIERLVVRDDKIVAIDLLTDQGAYDRFKSAGGG